MALRTENTRPKPGVVTHVSVFQNILTQATRGHNVGNYLVTRTGEVRLKYRPRRQYETYIFGKMLYRVY